MDDKLITALTAAGGAVGGAILAALANIYAAQKKLKELELAYRQKQHDTYLENARKVSSQVYIPLVIALSTLQNGYENFRTSIDFATATSPQDTRDDFVNIVRDYLGVVDNLMARGADAYLILELDERLQNFNQFLKHSLNSSKVQIKVILESNSPWPFVRVSVSRQMALSPGSQVRSRAALAIERCGN